MVTLRSTPLCSALALCFVLAACGTDSPASPGANPGASVSAPTVSSTNPSSNGAGVALNVKIAATFSGPMNPATITASTFTVQQGAAAVPGTVTYAGSTATFSPTSNLTTGTTFTATVSTGAQDTAGTALAAPYSWSFVTGTTTSKGPAPVGLGTAGNHVVLAKTAISSVPSSGLTGNIGLSPAAASFVTGFSLVADSTNVFATSTQVVGKVFAANYAVPTPTNLTSAIGNMESAYTDAAGRPTPDFLELGTGNIGGLTLVPGLYKWTSTVTIPANVTIAGGANDVWIFQTTGDLSMAAAKLVTLSGGAQAKNVFWQVAGQVTLGANSHFEGIILSKTAITLQTGATMNGRALAQTQVALQQATITQPAP
jgi:ice-binding like protein/Big-like domain-containing protein